VYKPLFDEFLTGNNTLRVYQDSKLIFASDKDRLLPLVEYIDKFASSHRDVVIFDRIMGRAAALLCIKANCREVYSPLGSKLALKVLEGNDIKYHLGQVVSYIQNADRKEMCPMEKLSLDKKPEEFYQLVKNLLAGDQH
jgi:hypothetical protein